MQIKIRHRYSHAIYLYDISMIFTYLLAKFVDVSSFFVPSAGNVEWFADAIETGAIKIPGIQKQYAKVNEQLEAID